MLAHDILGDPQAPSAMLVCHGILGSGRNWRGFARRLIDGLDGQWCAVLVDLRNHGRSPRPSPPHTIAACADDLCALGEALRPFDAVVGHSFGGKVALEYAGRLPPGLSQAWILDADPGPLDGDAARHEVSRVIGALRSISLPVNRRSDVQAQLLARGFSMDIARWMTTNLRREASGLVWRFDLDAVAEMIANYFTTDLWGVVEVPISDLEIHLVRAERSSRWRPEMIDRANRSFASLQTVPNAGHWLHVDNPDGLLEIMLAGFE